mgnify:FL=1
MNDERIGGRSHLSCGTGDTTRRFNFTKYELLFARARKNVQQLTRNLQHNACCTRHPVQFTHPFGESPLMCGADRFPSRIPRLSWGPAYLLWMLLLLWVLPVRADAMPKSFEGWRRWIERAEARFGEAWSVEIQDIATGRTLFAYEPRRRLVPASNRKLQVTAWAIENLGTDYRFSTEFGLSHTPEPDTAHFHGDMILRSNGDPSLHPVWMTMPDNPADLFRTWLADLVDRGIVYIYGDLLIDVSPFGQDQGCYPNAWEPCHQAYAYAPIPSALAPNHNLLRITVDAARDPGDPGRISLFPTDAGIEILNHTRTVRRGRVGVSAQFDETGSQLELSGRVRHDASGEVVLLPHPRPLEHVRRLMEAILEESPLSLQGRVRLLTHRPEPSGASPVVHLVGRHVSPPLGRFMLTMMRRSDNFLAEQIWRATAARIRGQGDLATARRLEQRWYREQGLPWIEPGWDGSGLSRRNRISAHEMIQLTGRVFESAHRDFLLYIMPRSGMRGTLRHRYFGSPAGRVCAKTGTLKGVSALTGFVLDRNERPRLIFSAMGNAPGETNGRLTTRVDRLIEIAIATVDELDRLPPEAQLARVPQTEPESLSHNATPPSSSEPAPSPPHPSGDGTHLIRARGPLKIKTHDP